MNIYLLYVVYISGSFLFFSDALLKSLSPASAKPGPSECETKCHSFFYSLIFFHILCTVEQCNIVYKIVRSSLFLHFYSNLSACFINIFCAIASWWMRGGWFAKVTKIGSGWFWSDWRRNFEVIRISVCL